jgi:hypothetical protein
MTVYLQPVPTITEAMWRKQAQNSIGYQLNFQEDLAPSDAGHKLFGILIQKYYILFIVATNRRPSAKLIQMEGIARNFFYRIPKTSLIVRIEENTKNSFGKTLHLLMRHQMRSPNPKQAAWPAHLVLDIRRTYTVYFPKTCQGPLLFHNLTALINKDEEKNNASSLSKTGASDQRL